MSSNVGLSTPRGSGTSGYVQRSLSHLKPRDFPSSSADTLAAPSRAPDASILRHDRLRAVEAAVFALRDELEEAGAAGEDEIDAQCEALRARLLAKEESDAPNKRLKAHQSHDIAAAKIKEDDRLRRALGIRRDYEEGGHWRRREEGGKVPREGGGGGGAGKGGNGVERVREQRGVKQGKSALRREVSRNRSRSRSRSPQRERSRSRSLQRERRRSPPRHRDWDRPGRDERRRRSPSDSRSRSRSVSRGSRRSRRSYSD